MTNSHLIDPDDSPVETVGEAATSRQFTAPRQQSDELAAVERAHIVDVLRRQHGNKARTARVLNVNRRSLYRLLERYAIQAAEYSDVLSR
jgi:transcriptional regulator with PAS, ATPase and Fis domain